MRDARPADSIKEPIPAIFEAWELLSSAADAHLIGDHVAAEDLFRKANLSEVWHSTNPAWGPSPRMIGLNPHTIPVACNR